MNIAQLEKQQKKKLEWLLMLLAHMEKHYVKDINC